jgi:tetratricopeptide (TPR) repeat protein
MKYWVLILLFAGCLCSCKDPKSDIIEARKLNNAAIDSLSKAKDVNKGLVTAIRLLDQAIELDGNDLIAYYNKFTFQKQLKRYTDAITTGKQMIEHAPNNAEMKVELGEVYTKISDTVSAKQYFKSGMVIYNKVLDTMRKDKELYNSLKMESAVDLIILGEQEKGQAILNELFTNEKNRNVKHLYQQLMSLTKDDMLNGKAIMGNAASEVY